MKIILEEAGQKRQRRSVVANLTSEAIWIQDVWTLRKNPLAGLTVNRLPGYKDLSLISSLEPTTQWILCLPNEKTAELWDEQILAMQKESQPETPNPYRRFTDGVSLLQSEPKEPYEVIGKVEDTGHTVWNADRGMQLRAGILGADAIVAVHRHQLSNNQSGSHYSCGNAVLFHEPTAREQSRVWYYNEGVKSICQRGVSLIGLSLLYLFCSIIFTRKGSYFKAPIGETLEKVAASAAIGVCIIFTWPIIQLILLRICRWPQLLRATGVVVLAATFLRIATVWIAHWLAIFNQKATPSASDYWMFFDIFDLPILIGGIFFCAKAWSLARHSQQILPQSAQILRTPAFFFSHCLFALSCLYAISLIGLVGYVRFSESNYLLTPGVNPKEETLALKDMEEGLNFFNGGKLDNAEAVLRSALKKWEQLTAKPPVPPRYLQNLATTLYNLGLVTDRQGKVDQAYSLFEKALAINDKLPKKEQEKPEFKEWIDWLRDHFAEMNQFKNLKEMNDKDDQAARLIEEAQAKVVKEPGLAEPLIQKAIALRLQILTLAKDEETKKDVQRILFFSYCHLAELQIDLKRLPAAVAALEKAIFYGNKAEIDFPEDRDLKQEMIDTRKLLADLRVNPKNRKR